MFEQLLKSGPGAFVAYRCIQYLSSKDLMKIFHHLHFFDGFKNIKDCCWNFLEHLILHFCHLEVVQIIIDQIFHGDNLKFLIFHPSGDFILQTIMKKSITVIHLRYVVTWITHHLDILLSERTSVSVVVSALEMLLGTSSYQKYVLFSLTFNF